MTNEFTVCYPRPSYSALYHDSLVSLRPEEEEGLVTGPCTLEEDLATGYSASSKGGIIFAR